MKTIRKLCARFARLYPDYEIYFDEMESYKGYYIIYITEPVLKLTSRNIFESCRDFAEWTNRIVLY